MNNLILKGKMNLEGMEFNHIQGGFGKDKKAMLGKDIADIHGRELKEINRRINDNKKRFTDGVDIIDLKNGDLKAPLEKLGFSNRDVSISNNIYLLSERGYSKLLKVLEDDFAWEQYEKLVDGYFNMRETLNDNLSELSPQLQLLINMELKQREIEMAITETKQEVQGIRDTMVLDHDSWRKECNNLINKIAKQRGGTGEAYRGVREEVYSLIEQRAGAKLKTRIVNKQDRMRREGTSETKVKAVSQVDVIAEDKKLKEIYIAVVKEMAIKYGA